MSAPALDSGAKGWALGAVIACPELAGKSPGQSVQDSIQVAAASQRRLAYQAGGEHSPWKPWRPVRLRPGTSRRVGQTAAGAVVVVASTSASAAVVDVSSAGVNAAVAVAAGDYRAHVGAA